MKDVLAVLLVVVMIVILALYLRWGVPGVSTEYGGIGNAAVAPSP